MHRISLERMGVFFGTYIKPAYGGRSLRILDVGSMSYGGGTYRRFVEGEALWEYRGLDMAAGNNVDIVVGDGYDWKEVCSGEYDVVISGQCLEHVEYPWRVMLEVCRVMKRGGIGCIIVPSSGHEHRFPVDCYRYFPDGMKALARYAGLDVIECYGCWGDKGADNFWKDTVLIFSRP